MRASKYTVKGANPSIAIKVNSPVYTLKYVPLIPQEKNCAIQKLNKMTINCILYSV